MKRPALHFLLLCMMLICVTAGYAQTITITTGSTPSICYNDGTLTVNAAGGTAPYTYSITVGPSNPNISYPITLPAGQNVFNGLASGTYTVTVHDAAGHTGTFSAAVGGSYQFPTLVLDTPTGRGDPNPSIACVASGGTAPYEYAISSQGFNTGFGPYQSSDSFSHICPGIYWVRVRDACGNIYTQTIHFNYLLASNIVCANLSNGILHVRAIGGHGPYTYNVLNNTTGGTATNVTGDFLNLQPYVNLNVTITDSCGSSITTSVSQLVQRVTTTCPYDGNYYGSIISGDTFTAVCANCIPVQRVTFNGPTNLSLPDTIFRNIPAGVTPQIFALVQTACGIDTMPIIIVVRPLPAMTVTYPGCNSISMHVFAPGTSTVVVDSFVLNHGPGTPTIESNTTGDFSHLPGTHYMVYAYVHQPGGCLDTLSMNIVLPAMNIGCYQQMRDSTCQKTWVLDVGPEGTEKYSLITALHDTIRQSDVAGQPNKAFYNVPPGEACTIISNDGCAVPANTPVFQPQISSISYTLPCASLPVVDYKINRANFCTFSVKLKVFRNGVMVENTTISPITAEVIFTVPDSGLYTYMAYIYTGLYTPQELIYDTICPIDSGTLYIINNHTPYPSPAYANICDSNSLDPVYYNIVGGFAPYTVQIPGYDTVTLTGNIGEFPSHHPGTYTMIVYDNCGASRSIAFSIIDSCHGCPTVGFVMSDTAACAGDTVYMTSTSVNAVAYEWLIDQQSYSGGESTYFVADGSPHDIQLIAAASSGCIDSANAHLSVAVPYAINIGNDTTYCDAFSRVLSTGVASTVWSTGVTAAQITVTSPGLYIATVSSGCGVQKDSILLNQTRPPAAFMLGDDTTYCGAFSRVLSTGIAQTVWSTGVTAAQITVTAPGLYIATVSNGCGASADSVEIFSDAIYGLLLTADSTTLCSNRADTALLTASLDSSRSATATIIWSSGAQSANAYSSTLPVYVAGNYTVTAQRGQCSLSANITIGWVPCDTGCNPCDTICTICDTACVPKMAMPNIFTPNGDGRNDTFLILHTCDVYGYTMRIYNRWGQDVYETTDIDKGWDGNYRGKPQPSEVYMYIMCAAMKQGDPVECKEGKVTLIR